MLKKLLLTLLIAPIATFAQFTENFDGGTTIPTGWTVINGGDTNTWQIIDFSGSTTISAHSGTKAAGIAYGATAHADYLITPAITVTAGVSDFLSFWGRSRDPLYPEVISVRLSTTGTAAANFTTIIDPNVAPASGTAFYKYQYDLSAYVGQTIYIGFYSETTDKFYFDIDDVQVSALPSCSEPTNPLVSNITSQSADVAWTSANTNFQIEYGTTGFTLGTGQVLNPTQTSATISGLLPNTNYQFYLRTNCGNSNFSAWFGPIAFKTKCESVSTFPFNQSFDNATIPDCWSNETVSGTANWTYVTTNGNNTISPRTGARMAEFRTTVTGNKTKLVTPPLNLTTLTNPQLTFYYANVNWVGDIDELRIFYKTSDTGAWVQIGTDYTAEQTSWTQVTLTLPNPSATYYIAFEATSNWARGLNLEDVTVNGTLSNNDFNSSAFSLYPNPVKDNLNIGYKETVKNVEIYNLLGQMVASKNINANEGNIDLSALASGNYLAKVYFENSVKSIKIIKQ